jgi:hypothetical protein
MANPLETDLSCSLPTHQLHELLLQPVDEGVKEIKMDKDFLKTMWHAECARDGLCVQPNDIEGIKPCGLGRACGVCVLPLQRSLQP